MIGIVIITHGELGKVLVDTAEMISGNELESVITLSTDTTAPDNLKKMIAGGIRNVDQKDGVLILTDMFGGTPCNIGCSFIDDGHVDVISAVNLPILLKAVNSRKAMKFPELSKCLEAYGKKSISLASDILKGNGRNTASHCPFGSECL